MGQQFFIELSSLSTKVHPSTFPVGLGFLCDEDCETAETPETSKSCLYSHFEWMPPCVSGLNHMFLYTSTNLPCTTFSSRPRETVFLKLLYFLIHSVPLENCPKFQHRQ